MEGITQGPEKFVRVHGPGNQVGHWVVRAESIANLTPAQIKDKLSLKYTPTHVSNVLVPENTNLRRGLVNSNFGGNAGAIQYEIVGPKDLPLNSDWFSNMRPLK